MTARALWTVDAMAAAMGAERQGALPQSVSGPFDRQPHDRSGGGIFCHRGSARRTRIRGVRARGWRRPCGGCRRRRAQFAKDTPLLVVPDVLAGLRDLAAAARARTLAKVIGVTGSVGKTGTKEALRLALSKDGETHASVASYNNHWGVPLSLARCPASARYAVLEMGMNHPARSRRCRGWRARTWR